MLKLLARKLTEVNAANAKIWCFIASDHGFGEHPILLIKFVSKRGKKQ